MEKNISKLKLLKKNNKIFNKVQEEERIRENNTEKS
jgi:hypothetical protein